ncbi:MAG TPA: four helix bundle protein [Clostridia bacterium]|nr:four helix bundle protein [Clostridia bacterium]
MTNMEFAKEMQARTKRFALQIIRLFQQLPKTDEARILGKQILRSGTSVAANYRAACRAKSRPDFVSKLGTTVEETDETLLWLELLEEASIVPTAKLDSLKHETDELLRILSTSLSTAKGGS